MRKPTRPTKKRPSRKTSKTGAGKPANMSGPLIDHTPGNDPNVGPTPCLPDKHALNPPIVTIFGAGVAGLTAAHEMVERGFCVQVVEATSDPDRPDRPIVGGMVANQPARVRANLEDLHPELIEKAAAPSSPSKPVADWLLRLFAFNRSRWIQSEAPEPFNPFLDQERLARKESVIEALIAAYTRYRERWIWDLTVRGVLIKSIRYSDPTPHGIALDDATTLFRKMVKTKDSLALAKEILGCQVGKRLPSAAQLEAQAALVRDHFQREFLCFELQPSNQTQETKDLVTLWHGVLSTVKELKGCLLEPSRKRNRPHRQARKTLFADPRSPSPESTCVAVDIIEQRLPGEHGFHFFPSYYRHVADTMGRIPLVPGDTTNGRSVLDNLKPTVFQGLGFSAADRQEMKREGAEPFADDEPGQHPAARGGGTVVTLYRDRPTSLEGLRDRTDRFIRRLGGTVSDGLIMFSKLARFMCACPERRRKEYEGQSWADFLGIGPGAKQKSRLSRPIVHEIQSAAQALLAFSASEADARSYGDTAVQMLLDGQGDGSRVDRTLNGPTSEAWIEPWRAYLEHQGVRFFQGGLTGLATNADDEVVPTYAWPNGKPDGFYDHEAAVPGRRPDFYVLALNVERAYDVVKTWSEKKVAGLAQAPDFAALIRFGDELELPWTGHPRPRPSRDALKDMTGLQFFFDARTSIGDGHMYFPYTKWGLSSISQSVFWAQPGSYADGYFDILSVGICDTGSFENPAEGTFWSLMKRTKPLPKKGVDPEPFDSDRRRLQIAQQVWKDLEHRISDTDALAAPRCFHLDRNIVPWDNPTRFLASLYTIKTPRPGTQGDWRTVGLPEIKYALNHKRWVLCGTYMATHTRVTTMESANESARHATIAILSALELTDSEKKDHTYGPALGIWDGDESQPIWIESFQNKTYNGASDTRVFDLPDIWNVEENELEDLDFFRRVDRRLVTLGLPHLFDILDLDRKLDHAVEGWELYRSDEHLRQIFGSAVAELDAALLKELGTGYGARMRQEAERVADTVPHPDDPLFDPTLRTSLQKMNDAFLRWMPKP